MKPRKNPNTSTTVDEMIVGATYLVSLAAFTAGVLFLIVGAATQELRLLGAGVLSLAISASTRRWLRPAGRQDDEDHEAASDEAAPVGSPHEAQIAELVQLLLQWEHLESKRGTRGFNPWAVLAVRHDIRQIVDANPELDRLFRGSLQPA